MGCDPTCCRHSITTNSRRLYLPWLGASSRWYYRGNRPQGGEKSRWLGRRKRWMWQSAKDVAKVHGLEDEERSVCQTGTEEILSLHYGPREEEATLLYRGEVKDKNRSVIGEPSIMYLGRLLGNKIPKLSRTPPKHVADYGRRPLPGRSGGSRWWSQRYFGGYSLMKYQKIGITPSVQHGYKARKILRKPWKRTIWTSPTSKYFIDLRNSPTAPTTTVFAIP